MGFVMNLIRSTKSLFHKRIFFKMGKTTEQDFYSFEFIINFSFISSCNLFKSLYSFTLNFLKQSKNK